MGLSRTDKRFYNVVHSLKTHHLTQAESKVVVKNTITGKDTRLCFAVLPGSHAEVHYFIFSYRLSVQRIYQEEISKTRITP